MPIQFAHIDELLDTEGISLPIKGKDYVIPPPDALTGLEVTRMMAAVNAAANGGDVTATELQELIDIDELAGGNLERRTLGPAFDEMVADGVGWDAVKLAFQTALIWISQGAEDAARFWLSGGGALGKAPAPAMPQDRKPPTRKARPVSTASRSPRK